MLKGVRVRLEDLRMVIAQTEDQRQRVLNSVGKDLPKWIVMVKKIKAIYFILNQFSDDVSRKCLIGECWVPTSDVSKVQKALIDGSAAVGSTIPSFLNIITPKETPPTFNRVNRFTSGFQSLIDAYGVSSYREVNPALYTIITFPFLFAVMFGDLGHGLILFLFGLWMVISEKSLIAKNIRNEIWTIFFGGRYIILLMGMFSMYTGLIYNDVFSKGMRIIPSAWQIEYDAKTVMDNVQLQLDPNYLSLKNETVYWLGIDPAWMLATNKIIFLNSFKMKMSIIVGILHMVGGVCLSTVNFNFFKRRLDIFTMFLPQVLFVLCLFGYMCFMMFWKWIYFAPKNQPPYDTHCSPSVLIFFINMMLFSDEKTIYNDCNPYMFEMQATIQSILVPVALICIPWMLVTKPLTIMWCGGAKSHVSSVEFRVFSYRSIILFCCFSGRAW